MEQNAIFDDNSIKMRLSWSKHITKSFAEIRLPLYKLAKFVNSIIILMKKVQ